MTKLPRKAKYAQSFAEARPDLVPQWSSENFHGPEKYSAQSNHVVMWVCNQGHSWQARIRSRFASKGQCPVCAGKYICSGQNDAESLNPALALEWSDKNEKPLSTYGAGSHYSGLWECQQCHHEWKSTIRNRSRGSGTCPQCKRLVAQQAKATLICGVNDLLSQKPESAKQWNFARNKDVFPSEVLSTSRKVYWWVCEEGHEWQMRVDSHNSDNACPYCANKQVLAGWNDVESRLPEVLSEWDYDKNSLKPFEVFYASSQRVWFRCITCHYSWETSLLSRSKGHGCPECALYRDVDESSSVGALRPELITQWSKDNEKSPYEVHYGSHFKALWECGKHGQYLMSVGDKTRNDRDCPQCSPRHRSRIEIRLEELLVQSGLAVSGNVTLPVSWGQVRVSKCDILAPAQKTIIEYDGSYWHKDKQEKDEAKTRALLEAGYRVIRVRENPLSPLAIENSQYAEVLHTYGEDLALVTGTIMKFALNNGAR